MTFLEKHLMIPIKIVAAFSPPITILPCPEIPESVQRTACYAASIFIQPNPHAKVYFSVNSERCYAKAAPMDPRELRSNNSIRKLAPQIFILTLNRKSLATIAGRGSFKVVKTAWLITIRTENNIHIEPIICAKTIRSTKEPCASHVLRTLPENLPGVECVEKYTHKTSKNGYKQFHQAPRALCDLSSIFDLPKPPNFNQLSSIMLGLSIGILKLSELGLTHGDLKPSNVLIYLQDGNYFTKLTDIDSLAPIGSKLQDQTWDYLSPFHRHELIQSLLMSKFNPTTNQIAEFYFKVLESKHYCVVTPESTLQTLGLVFADILFGSTTSQGTPEQMELLWTTIGALIGFRPSPGVVRRKDFNEAINKALIQLAKERKPCPMPTITLEEVIHRLTIFATPTPNTEISLAGEGETEDGVPAELKGGSEREDLSKLQSLFPQIFRLIQMDQSQKVYFDFLGGYTKSMNQTVEYPLPHCFRRLDFDSWLVILDRKKRETLRKSGSNTKVKSGWLITASTSNQYIAKQTLVRTDQLSKYEFPRKWSMEILKGLSSVALTGERFPFATSGHIIKRLHLIPGMPIDGYDFAIRTDGTTFLQFWKLCIDIITGVAELHENGYIYGNLKINKVYIYTDPITGNLSAKISPSATCDPIGSVSYQATFSYLSPKLQIKIKNEVSKKIEDPSFKEVTDFYSKDTSAFELIIMPRDEAASVGIILSELATLKPEIFRGTTLVQKEQFWSIIQNLTGNSFSCRDFIRGTNFHQEIYRQITSRPASSPPPQPKITLREAAIALKELCSSSLTDMVAT